MDAILVPTKYTKDKNESFSANKSAPRRGRGLLDTIRGSQSSQNARITRIQPNPLLAAQRGPPRIGPNNQMLQSGSNSLRNVIKNDVFITYFFKLTLVLLIFLFARSRLT